MLKTVLLEEEFRLIPDNVASKIDKILNEASEQYLNLSALFETFKRDQGELLDDVQARLAQEIERRESIQLELATKSKEFDELDAKVGLLQKQNLQLKNDLARHESDARTYRTQRDELADEKSSLETILNRRTNELESLKFDYDSINEKLRAAIQAKIEALTQLDEIQSKKIELDFKEKRLEKERELLNEQINLLTNDVTKHNNDVVTLRREHNSQVVVLQAELQRKTEELRTLMENEENYKKTIASLNEKIEELNERLTGRSEVENELRNKYIAEIESRTKLADVYKEMSEESSKKSEELAKTAKDLQKLLDEAETQYKSLEKQYAINESTYKEHLQKKNDTIAALKKELFDANNLIDALKQEHLNDTLENLSPHAAAAYNMMRKGLTLTQIYTEYASVSEQLMIKTHDNEQLQNTFKSFIEELEGKAHIIKKRNEDYTEAMATLEKITQNYGQLELEFETMKAKYADAERNQARLTRDNDRLQKTISDLSRQVCFLLKEVEESRGGEILIRSINDTSDCLTSADVISKKLVTFHDIQELQETNRKLLSALRDLSEEFENAETKLKASNKEELESKLTQLESAISEKNDALARQEKIIQMFKNQLNMYKLLDGDRFQANRSYSDNNRILDVPMIEMGNTRAASIQTNGSEIENHHCAELQKELNAKNREIANLKTELEAYTKEHSINEKMMLESLEKAEKSFQKLSHDHKSLLSRSENTEEKCKCLKLTVGSMKAEITALENKCKTYSQTIGKHEQTINVLREEAMNAMSALSRNEVMLENAKRECAMLRESEARIIAERDVLKQDKQNHAYLLSNIESIKASIERSESEWKMKIEEKWNTAERECSALRRRLQDEQDRFNEKVALLEKALENAKNRLENEKRSNIELSEMVKSLRDDLQEKNKVIDELKNKLKTSSSESVAEMELLMKNLQNKYQQSLKEIEHHKEIIQAMKKDAEEIAKLSENFESLLVAEREAHIKYKKDMEAKVSEFAGEVAGLRKQNNILQKRVNELLNLNQTSMINLNDELLEEKRKYSTVVEEINIIKQQLAAAQADLKVAIDAKLVAEKKYTDEMLQHTEDIKELKSHIDAVMTLKGFVAQLTNERDAAVLKAESNANDRLEQEKRIQEEMDAQKERMKDLIQQNELLLNQIQELSLRLSIKQSNNSMDEGNSSTLSDDGERNTDNLFQVISYLKREKNLATSQLETLLSENRRLKSEIELIKSQFEETRSLLNAEQQKTDISTTTAARHAELINKVQTLNALSDSNRVLREERDRYAAELSEIKETLEKIESKTLIPLRNENKQMSLQLETLQTENLALQKECARWRTRVTEMTEKINKNNAEDLQKSLNMERDAHNKTLEDLRAVKQEKSRLEDQLKKTQGLHNRIAALEKERNDLQKERSDLQKELSEEKTKNTKVNQDFEELQKTFAAHETVINDLKSSNTQVRSIARKYKSQCQELTKQIEDVKKKPIEAQITPVEIITAPAEISIQEQDRLRQEGRQQVEAETNDRIKQLNDQLTTNQGDIDRLQAEIERLLTENKSLQDTVQEKEVRATDILKTARARILSLTRETKKCQEENESLKEKIKHFESTRAEGIARENVIKSAYESRISKLEKEKTDGQNDRERLVRENEILSQKVSLLQRQLNTQQGVKSAVNSGQEKSNIEPPTANIKPLAGPSSSVAKSQQNQQSVAVTPWRSGNETPFASIRPMSMQTRTAAVLPTSQMSCSSASQSTVLVPPQQQLVDTSSNAPSIVEAFSSSPSSSSHTDYNMPSTSSSVSHTSVRQVVVTPTQQTSHSAESTQDMEAECGNQELPSQASLSGQQQSSQVSQNQSSGILTLSSIMAAPSVSQSQTPTVALVLPRIDLQNAGGPSHLSNVPEQSMVASSQTTPASLVSASNQTDSSNAQKRAETYYQPDGEDSNPGQVSASNQHSQQQAVVASSIETAPEQSIIIASSQQSNDKNVSEPSVASSNANSSNTVTTTQAGLKRSREMEGESSKSSCSTEVNSVQPKVKRSRRMETVHEEIFRNDIDEASNTDMLLRYGAIDVEYQVPTSSQRDQEFDNLGIDSEAEDELEEDEQTMPDDGIIDENDDVQEYVEDEEEVESEEVYEMEGYDREEQDTPINRYTALEGPDIDEEGVQVHDQDNEVEILDEESSEVPNQSGRSDSAAIITTGRNLEQQSSDATSSGNNLRAQSASITSNQSSISLQFSRRPSTISPLNRQQNQPLLLSQGFEDNTGDDSIVPSTPTLCVPRRTDGFGEAVSSPHVPSGGRFTFSESNPPGSRAEVAQMVSEGIDDTRMDLSQLDENASTGRSVPSTPLQSSPQEIERIEIGQSIEDSQQLNEELSSNTSNQQPQPVEDILLDNVAYHGDAPDNELEVANESENLIDEPTEQGRDENNDGVTSDSGQSDPLVAGTSQNREDDIEEGREAEAVTKNSDLHPAPQQIPTTATARRIATRAGRQRRNIAAPWENPTISNTQDLGPSRGAPGRGRINNPRGAYRRGNRRQRSWTPFGRY